MKVLFLTYMPPSNASARNRVHEYLPYLEKAGIEYRVAPPFPDSHYRRFLHPRHPLDRARTLLLTLRNRLAQLEMAGKYDCVFLQRELFQYGPPVLERTLRRINPNIIYDFDDAVWGYAQTDAGKLRRFLVDYDKVGKIAGFSSSVIAATHYLGDSVRRYNPNAVVIPDPINVHRVQPKTDYKTDAVTIGWAGNPTNLPSLDLVAGALRRLSREFPVQLKVVCSTGYQLEGVKVVNKRWKLEDEAADLRSFDIGLMPLADDEVGRGKGGIKALMCMAAGVPVVCSPVGENNHIIRDGETGFLAGEEDEWLDKLRALAMDEMLRRRLGTAGRGFVADTYPPERLAPLFIQTLVNASLAPAATHVDAASPDR